MKNHNRKIQKNIMMKNKKTIQNREGNKLFSRMTAFLLAMLFAMLSPLSLFVSAADTPAAQADAPHLTVSLAWETGTTSSGVGASGVYTAKVKIKVTANDPAYAGESTRVVVKTFDISARASLGEYTPATFDGELQAGSSATLSIAVGVQKKGNSASDHDNGATKIGGVIYTRQFGVRIVEVGDNAEVGSTHTLRSHIRNNGSSLTAVTNDSLGSKYDAGSTSAPGCLVNGYTYSGAADVLKGTYKEVEVPDDKTETVTVWPGQLFSSGAYAYTALKNYFPSINIYFAGEHKIYDKKITDAGGWKMTITHNGETLFMGDRTSWYNFDKTYFKWFETTHFNSNATSKLEGVMRGDFTSMVRLTNPDGSVDIKLQNHASTYNKWFQNIAYYAAYVDNTAPQILEYHTDATSMGRAYREGEEIYLAVRFSKPVQVEEGQIGEFYITTKVGDSYLRFYYVDGSYTDTLIFKGTLEVGNNGFGRADYFDNKLTIQGIHHDRAYARVADMLLNSVEQNNHADLEHDMSGASVACNVDTRLPGFQVTPKDTMTEYLPTHKVEILPKNMEALSGSGSSYGGIVSYGWSPTRDIEDVLAWTSFTPSSKAETITGSGYNGTMYLHIRATSASGMDSEDVEGPFCFDNTGPSVTVAPAEDGEGNIDNFSVYQKTHSFQITVKDDFNKIVKLTILYRNGLDEACEIPLIAYDASLGLEQPTILKDFSHKLTEVKDKDGAVISTYYLGEFTVTLSHEEMGLEENSYDSYRIGFFAEDEEGNKKEYVYSDQRVLFDNREIFVTESRPFYGDSKPIIVETETADLGGTKIFYNRDTAGALPLTFEINGLESAGTVEDGVEPADMHVIHHITLDGKTIYENGKWADGKYSGDYGFAGITKAEVDALIEAAQKEAAETGGEYIPPVFTDDGIVVETDASYWKMQAKIVFSESANGLYEIVFLQTTSGKESDVFSVNVSSRDAAPTNYRAFYDPERLLINKVWRFATANYYTINNAQSLAEAYDRGTSAAKSTPIFSSYEKAYEYALFMEKQDVQVLRLTGDDISVIQQLNSGGSNLFSKAAGENTTAAAGQVWIRYKAKSWTPHADTTRATWVYYHYSTVNPEDRINPDALGSLLLDAMTDNAAEIANAATAANPAGGEYFLTKSTGGVDSYGQPTYAKGAIYYDDIVVTPAESVYATDLVYHGDTAIYDSFITDPTGTVQTPIPLVANYTFVLHGAYEKVYYRPVAGGADAAWLPVENGAVLRDLIKVSGLYELAEIGGGYKCYYIYCDFDAPIISYTATRSTDGPESALLQFGAEISGTSFSAVSLTLHGFVDAKYASEQQLSGLPIEYDKYSYLYLTSGRNYESVYTMMTMSDLKNYIDPETGERGFTFPSGEFTMYVYDRLGNCITIKVLTNTEKIFVREPTVTENRSIMFHINRDADEIMLDQFVVTCDGVKIDAVFATELTFKQSGVYTVTVVDVYGTRETQTGEFQRKMPEVSFYYKNKDAAYVHITPTGWTEDGGTADSGDTGEALVERTDAGTYYVSTSADIRIAYNVYAGYVFSFTTEDVTYTTSSTSSQTYINIPVSDKAWALKIYYEDDENKYIFITCTKDTTAPEVAAVVSVVTYEFNEQYGCNNVLFSRGEGLSEITASSGDTVSGESVKFTWSDESGVASVSYSVDGSTPIAVDDRKGYFTSTASGKYVVTVRDILGNITVFELNLASGLDFDILSGNTPISYKKNPSAYISGVRDNAVYNDTVYAGKEITLRLRENVHINFAWRIEEKGESTLYTILFEGDVLKAGSYKDMNGGENETDESKIDNIDLGEKPSGKILASHFPMTYSLKDGELVIVIGDSNRSFEFWQIRVTNDDNVNPCIIQFERSNETPNLGLKKVTDGAILHANGKEFTGTNSALLVTGDTERIISVVAMRSDRHTSDFTNVDPQNVLDLFVNEKLGQIEKEGYYKIVITNRYGNEQILLVCIGFGLRVDVEIRYQEIADREYSLSIPDSYSFYTNGGVTVKIWDPKAEIFLTKNRLPIGVDTSGREGYLELKLEEEGEYVADITDEYDNSFSIRISVQAPLRLTYNDFLTGFNENALKREDNYTNGPVSLSLSMLEAFGIRYAAYKKVNADNYTVLYDMISQTKTEYSAATFRDCVGKENGSYEVMFTDAYGNRTSTIVHISDAEKLAVSRQTQNTRGEEAFILEEIQTSGAWSNYIVRLKNTSSLYELYVDGIPASFNEKNEYTLEFAPGMSEGGAEHTVSYLDEYGNRYSFGVHFYRKVPVVTSEHTGELISLGSTMFVKGDISYAWDDPRVFCTYVKDGGESMTYTKGASIAEDGAYILTFEDIAGNTTTARITRDTVVSYDLIRDNDVVYNGVAASGTIRISRKGEELTVMEMTINGEPAAIPSGLSFSAHGDYVLILSDPIGNTAQVAFRIFSHPVQTFTYVTDGDYAISQVWYTVGSTKMSYAGGILLGEDGRQQYTFLNDGEYEIELWHAPSGGYQSFAVEIDNVAPTVNMLGAYDGGTTRETVTFEGLESGDVVEVWIDGKLKNTYQMTSALDAPELEDAGDYEVIVRDEAGNLQSFRFVREFTTNTASNLMICLVLFGIAVGATAYLRTREKFRTK